MVVLSKLRKWINRDDGKFLRVGNEPIRMSALIGVLVLVLSLGLKTVQVQAEMDSGWAIATGIVGLALLMHGLWPNNRT